MKSDPLAPICQLWTEGNCEGRVDVVDSVDGSGVFMCERHGKEYLEALDNEI